MNADRILMLKLLGDTSSIDKSLKKSQGRLRSFAGSAGSWMKAAGIGLAIEGVQMLGDALGDAWTGFRDGEKAAGQLGVTWQNLGLDGTKLQKVIDEISAGAKRLGTDDTEAINAYNTALQNTGGNAASAMRRLRIAQDLVANGSAPNLQSALKLIDRAGSGSAATVRKFGLTADTAKGRIKELGEKVKGAAAKAAAMDPVGVLFNDLNEDLEGIVGSLSQGDLDGALASLQQIGTDLGTAWDKVAGPITTILDKITGGGFSNWISELRELGDRIGPKVAGAFDAMSEAWTTLQPHLQNALTFIQPLIDLLSNTVAGGLGFVLDAVTGSLTLVKELLEGDFAGAFESVKTTVSNLATDIDTFFSGLPGKLITWAGDVLAGAASVGGAIYDGIVEGITGLTTRVSEILTGAIETLKGLWNSIDFVIPPFDLKWDGVSVPVPAEVPGFIKDAFGITGNSFQIIPGGSGHVWDGTGDLIPDLAQGAVIRARPGGKIVRVGEGRHDEAVIPLDGRGGMGGNTTIIMNFNGLVTDPGAVGREVARVLEAAKRTDRTIVARLAQPT